jgi:uncharacterized circularly permuted ATP-grasp superfamily protein/uncharacterized alpha-E superfamily protein
LEQSANGKVCDSYQLLSGYFDEMRSAGVGPRSHWQTFFTALDALGPGELARRWEEAKHLIRENGVTYNVYGDPRGKDRPWELDPIPLVISSDEGRVMETGLVQRARVLDLLLADLYGPQKLLSAGLVPPELVFGHPGFLRPCHNLPTPGNRYLYLYAADLGRSPDGQVWVVGDRTQAPSGAGYALENRLVLARTLPDVFRDCQVQRLALFFRALRETLSALAPHNRDNPRIVLLTPGPYNETYFEHAYLARYLGYALVEGGDLTVRDQRLYLKLLGGLQPVDMVWRRLDDDYCDPLDLRGDSFLGVPGLVQSVRAGNLVVANALGSGLIETPALMPFLPSLCQHLLGEELRMPSVPTWWCGERRAMEHVLANLTKMVIKPTFPAALREPVFGEKLSREQRQALADAIRARPSDFVGQEQLALSTTPVLVGNHLQPRHLVLRSYLAASGESFVVMPGGLARVSATADTLAVSMQKGGGSKDTWVLSPGPVSTFSLLRPSEQLVELSRGGDDLPSRAADNLFWLGRYVERADGAVRLLRGILVRLTEKSGLVDVPELPTLLRALNQRWQNFPGVAGPGNQAILNTPESELLSLIFNGTIPDSLTATVNALYRVAGMVRDRISTDTWRILGSLDLREHEPPPDQESLHNLSAVLALLNRMVITLAAFGGLAMESMTRGQGWRFLDMGRRLERALQLVRLLRRTLVTVSGSEGPLLEALLEIADSSMTYRRRYLGSLNTAPVLDLLLADETNPRSVAYQLAALAEHVDSLPRDTSHPRRPPEQRVVIASLTKLRLADIDELARPTSADVRQHLADLLARLDADLPIVSDTITQHYLGHLQAPRQMAALLSGPLP